MTDPARAQIRELFKRLQILVDETKRCIDDEKRLPALRKLDYISAELQDYEAISRLGEPEAPARDRMRELRQMFSDGVDVARSYGDNAFHLWGEQLERQFQVALKRIETGGFNVQPRPAESPVSGTPRRCPTHGPLPGLRYCPECASSGEPWTDAQADAADASPLQSEDQETLTRGGSVPGTPHGDLPRPAIGDASSPAWQPIENCTVLSKPGEDRQIVFVYGPQIGMVRGYVIDYGDGTRHVAAEGFHGNWDITHWMPLPAPPHKGTK